jgi:hypothetical protein
LDQLHHGASSGSIARRSPDRTWAHSKYSSNSQSVNSKVQYLNGTLTSISKSSLGSSLQTNSKLVQKFSKSQMTIAAHYADFEAYLLKGRKNGRNHYA